MSDAEKLKKLADWFDVYDRTHPSAGNEVQRDLRRIAASLTPPEPSVEEDAELVKLLREGVLKQIYDTLGTYLAVKASQADWEYRVTTLRKLIETQLAAKLREEG